jgi:thiol-disulfide isomerase/thioredoxin
MRLVSLVGVGFLTLTACAAPRASSRASPLVGKHVQIEARSLDGRDVKLPARGAKVTVVDLWATWCDPCKEQMPALDRLAASVRDRGVEVYAISFDEDPAAVREFVARTPVRFPVLWDKGGASLADALSITRLPTTVVLDGAGVVRAVHLGYDQAQAGALEREVRELLAEDAQRAPGAAAAPGGGRS